MQCKDIDAIPILRTLYNNGIVRWSWIWGKESTDGGDVHYGSVQWGFPDNCPRKLVAAKMKSLIGKGLVDGCTCGCRGDFELTTDGLVYLYKEYYAKKGWYKNDPMTEAQFIIMTSGILMAHGYGHSVEGIQLELARLLANKEEV